MTRREKSMSGVRKVLSLVVILPALSACAATGQTGSRSTSGDITAADIQLTNAVTAHDLIRRLRPQWLRPRGLASINRSTPRMVYLDNLKVGGLDALRRISVSSVQRITFLDSREATQRFGTGHVNGAILIYTP
ncbi:MAG: hypothetical protein ACREKN_08125 [Longimicrobiaceae bacterium]